MFDAGEAAVVFDALLESGTATWPGVGTFALVAVTQKRMNVSPVVHVFPTRVVEFVAEPGFMQSGTFPGLGTVSPSGFVPDEKLLARVKMLPIQLFRVQSERLPVQKKQDAPAHRDERPWWRRIFGVD